MINTKRTPAYIKLLHSIRSCNSYPQLRTLSEMVIRHVKNNIKERYLIREYQKKEVQLITE